MRRVAKATDQNPLDLLHTLVFSSSHQAGPSSSILSFFHSITQIDNLFVLLLYLLHRLIMSHNGLDFSDGAQFPPDELPDLKYDADVLQPAHLQRNKTERGRLQGLQRFNTAVPMAVTPYVPRTFGQKWDRWMINEGGKRLFFSAWILLHLLVAVFGFLNYDLKDNLNDARATFGITFSAFFLA